MNAVALATLAATFVLILVGGLVTNTGAALAVVGATATTRRARFVPLAATSEARR